MVSLPIKDYVSALLANKPLQALIVNKHYKVDDSTDIYLEGELDFSLGVENGNYTITINSLKPKIVYKPMSFFPFKKVHVDGRISKITIMKDKLILAIDGLPDQTIAIN